MNAGHWLPKSHHQTKNVKATVMSFRGLRQVH